MLRPCFRISILILLLFSLLATGCRQAEPPPTTPEPTALDEPGPFQMAKYNTALVNDLGRYPSTVYYPAQSTSDGLLPDHSQGPYPAVTFSPGLASNKSFNRWVGMHLATHGYVVLIFTVPNPLLLRTHQQEAGFASGFDKLAAENANPASPLHNLVDLERRAIMGHSLGAMASLRAAAYMDVDAVVPLAPYTIETEALTAITAPTQIQAATQDCITGPDKAQIDYDNLGAQVKQLVTINGGNHVSFNDANSLAETVGGPLFDCPKVINTMDHHQRLSRRYFTAWLDYFLKGHTEVEGFLFGEPAQQDLLTELLTALEFIRP